VNGIYELRVQDSILLPHSEQMISQSVDEFDIEILDWMRVDMSLEPLLNGGTARCPNLRKLSVYVSSWAMLQYWKSEEVDLQLQMFPKVAFPDIVV
jgi:hypothetical protein